MSPLPRNLDSRIPPLKEDDHIQGSINALIVLMYGDYQCLQSGRAYRTLKRMQQEIQQQQGEELCIVFRHFPQAHLHPQAQKAAESAEAAHAQGKFWQMHELMFEGQPAIDDGDLVAYAAQLGLDVPRFLRELAVHAHGDRVRSDIESGHSVGVKKTPAFFIQIRCEEVHILEGLLSDLLKSSRFGTNPSSSP